jgi:hypothetical protein
MEDTTIVYEGDLQEVNIKIQALDRISTMYYNLIERYENEDPYPPESVAWAKEQHAKINNQIAELLTLKSKLGLPL